MFNHLFTYPTCGVVLTEVVGVASRFSDLYFSARSIKRHLVWACFLMIQESSAEIYSNVISEKIHKEQPKYGVITHHEYSEQHHACGHVSSACKASRQHP